MVSSVTRKNLSIANNWTEGVANKEKIEFLFFFPSPRKTCGIWVEDSPNVRQFIIFL